ncbi:MAG: Na+ dependent nucleoside transporter N-terminal domain-containing protein [Acidobacteriota bacterium]
MHRLFGLVGIAFLLGVAYLFSNNRAAIRWKTVVWGIVLQLLCGQCLYGLRAGNRNWRNWD